ncbi:prolipoprotein diacylglyceryl transferase [Shouchella shacheensis]|uniref:prolipoprotein diacylglyceryl transferase n=1 Tax=Shouchella shacheensis TaxID=1649580 RepID=UPI00073FE2ED|nr:prolipoprotein diacylglyceryl transferase [Shouchella shacheensis]
MEPLNRVAFEIGPFAVNWYGIIIMIGVLLGVWVANRETIRHGFPPGFFSDLLLYALPISIVSARLYYVVFRWEYFSQNPQQILAIWEGGIAIHGALIGAFLTAYVYTKKKQVSFWKVADIAAPSLILGQAIGRWGNFINQEAHGGPVTKTFLESLRLPDFIINQMYIDGVYYHPTFLYESVWNFCGFILFMLMRKLNPTRGYLIVSYAIWYSVGRFFIEGMRTDSLMVTESLRAAQLMSIFLVGLGVCLLVYLRRKYPDVQYWSQDQKRKPKRKKKKK